MIRKSWLVLIFMFALTACGQKDTPTAVDSGVDPAIPADPGMVVMADDLQELKDGFNANHGRVRLMFLNGPTCGICLRGLADLNDEFVAASQNDDRLVTFVVHVPTMGAKKHHAVDSMPLLDGPRVHHYWEESGIVGQHYAEVMDVDMYVWDFWAIYGPDVVWDGTLPPVPDYYEHQLGVTSGNFRGFPKERVLDAERFAARTADYLKLVDEQRFSSSVDTSQPEKISLADGAVIPHVGQPRNVAVSQHIIGRGGYKNLKRIQSVEAHGRFEANGTSTPIVVRSERPNVLKRIIGDGHSEAPGLPEQYESLLLDSFEFDGLFVEWPQKGHQVDMLGMQKFGDVLAWQLELIQNGGRHWHLYIDSHTGDLVRANILDEDGKPIFIIDQSDFRESSGFTFPHRVVYLSGSEEVLATETFDKITVDVEPFELEQEAVAH